MSNKVKFLRGSVAPLARSSETKLQNCEAKKALEPRAAKLHSERRVFCDQPTAFLSGTSSGQVYSFSTLNVTVPSPFVYNVEVNRPKKMNALNKEMWAEMGEAFTRLSTDPDCRVVVLSAAGRMFSAGIDLGMLTEIVPTEGEEDIARKSMAIYTHVRSLQEVFTRLEKCRKPVIACVHNACVGGGVDMITAADIRYCTADAWFCVREVDMGLAADVGTLQRLPKVIGSQSLVNELCFSGRKMMAGEAEKCGLVSSVFDSKEKMMEAALTMAAQIASKSPVAVQGTKDNLNFSREHPVQEGLDRVAMYNMSMLQSEDLMKAAAAALDKTGENPPVFSKL